MVSKPLTKPQAVFPQRYFSVKKYCEVVHATRIFPTPPKKQPFRVSVAACSDLEIERAIYAVFFSSWGVHRIFSRKNRTWRRSGIKTLGPTSMEWFTVIDYMIIIFALQSCSGFGSGCLFLVLFSIWVICTYTIISLSWIKFSFGRFPFLKPKN